MIKIFFGKLIEGAFRLGALFMIKRWGKTEAEKEVIEDENEHFKNVAFLDDAYLADQLRKRAEAKKNKDNS